MVEVSLKKKLQSADGEMLLDVSLKINKGEFVTIAGPSGVGKTTILRCIAGLSTPDEGTINIGQNIWLDTSNKINLSPFKRNIGFVFQDYALFPNMTVRENLEYALVNKKDKLFVNELLGVMEVLELQNRKPDTLSGGQKQRVAIARALVRKPEILLLDEPLSALDPSMRFKLQEFILSIHKKYNLTTVIVSHDISEIFKLSDKVILLENGKVSKLGKPAEIFISKKISGKFRLTGEVLSVEKNDVVYIVYVLSGSDIVKVIVGDEALNYTPGLKVMVISKAFNPVIIAI